jgi:hypothetical protein
MRRGIVREHVRASCRWRIFVELPYLKFGMDEIEIPVGCPSCGVVSLQKFPVLVVVIAVTSWKQMHLYSACHNLAWDASPSEIECIREHLGDAWIESQRQRLAIE